MSLQSTVIPDESVFAEFRAQCLSTENWLCKYNTCDMEVWTEMAPGNGSSASKVHKIKCRRVIQDVSAATMYDVLHDSQFRVKWDPTMLESFDIGRLSANTDVGYYSWLCPKPLKNRDVVTLRSWRVKDDEYLIINYSVMHPKYPPRTDLVRAVSIITGYMLKVTGPNSCVFFYLSQGDPKGSIPKWLVNKASQVLAPKVMMCLHKAGQCYLDWKENNSPERKPWLYPEQSELPWMDPAELVIQRRESLENVDESSSQNSPGGEKAEDSS
ncbi:START domain containing 14 [Paramormyrops kingsleyae]|uniref:START domain-containing protein 10 n=1 Tax=Paramormyrops kingsleyae TaxID=1676925 RepID=A0A3B3R0A6_9TELE|nr:START domain-containing protein 10-like [Paramormyrops kingsleyae]